MKPFLYLIAAVIWLGALAGCVCNRYPELWYDAAGAVHTCPNGECWQREAQMSYMLAALTAINSHPERAKQISDQILKEYWECKKGPCL